MATLEEKFNAAVRVIHSLPKNGPYEPSNSMKLHFYGLYKQATEGPCLSSRPNFWDIIGRAKWDAWKKIGVMPKEEAMALYVEDLKKEVAKVTSHLGIDQNPRELQKDEKQMSKVIEIVETMSYTDEVANFMSVIGPFFEFINMDSSEIPSDEGNGIAYQEEKETLKGAIGQEEPLLVDGQGFERTSVPENGFYLNGDVDSSNNSEADEYSDPMHMMTEEENHDFGVSENCFYGQSPQKKEQCNTPIAGGDQSCCVHSALAVDHNAARDEIHERIVQIVERLNQDMEHTLGRIRALEAVVSQEVLIQKIGKKKGTTQPKWCPFPELSPRTILFIMAWPFIAQALTYIFSYKRRQQLGR